MSLDLDCMDDFDGADYLADFEDPDAPAVDEDFDGASYLADWDIAEAREKRGAFRWNLKHGAFARYGRPPRLLAILFVTPRARTPHRTGRRVTVATSTSGAGDGEPAEPPPAWLLAALPPQEVRP